MRFLRKLLSNLYSAASSDPDAIAAMRIRHPDGGSWTVAEASITLQPLSDPLPVASVLDLRAHTLRTLAAAITDLGWNVEDLHPEHRDRGAICLIEETVTPADRPGGTLLAYDNPIFAHLDANAVELAAVAEVAASVGVQLSVTSADEIWLVELGDQYGIPRLPSEAVEDYRARIIAELIQPKSNNLAMAAVIERATGQATSVRDVTLYGPTVPLYDGAITHDGAYQHDADAKALHGVFDVETGFALEGGTGLTEFIATISAQAKRLRAAGTSLRSVAITGGSMADAAAGPAAEPGGIADLGMTIGLPMAEASEATDSAMGANLETNLADDSLAPDDAGDLAIAFTHTLDGSWTLNGTRPLSSGLTMNEGL
ncbi:hypothetical protein EOD42_22380 [Rhodovarius crocodyli]|uniref:Uncharacterized protein n=1 Tax=Rhodovarius crocodyli TaxID=1979269 RepID=A0A437M1F3_9PROT|nr:hypothetical protein [Rhodovarius crocodyli]RVT91405.1 hypothetical protein EOD42_22380 [Rhodovarius crocodyli]